MDDIQIAWHECGHAMYAIRRGIIPLILTCAGGLREELVPAGEKPRDEHYNHGLCDLGENAFQSTEMALFEFMMAGPAAEDIGATREGYAAGENCEEIIEACELIIAYEVYVEGRHLVDSLKVRNDRKDRLGAIRLEQRLILEADPLLPALAAELVRLGTMTMDQIGAWLTNQP